MEGPWNIFRKNYCAMKYLDLWSPGLRNLSWKIQRLSLWHGHAYISKSKKSSLFWWKKLSIVSRIKWQSNTWRAHEKQRHDENDDIIITDLSKTTRLEVDPVKMKQMKSTTIVDAMSQKSIYERFHVRRVLVIYLGKSLTEVMTELLYKFVQPFFMTNEVNVI